ncbi:hypothetical protein [Mariniblastus fucicola]|uniref:Uncharacterized protein n=1 Tax=Mariniblastus fucicola TaxID=980251 RepID=A0A5B9PE22_9BACT|nr:hypothetical protein [Mariniblastus fucicola]QEG21193.1 hypothetical protein MFFC18_10480 [Mariniblastus fucicola]
MISRKPTQLVLILAATFFLPGCAIKPRQQSRFHNVAADGSCNCYTCRSCGGYIEDVSATSTLSGHDVQYSSGQNVQYTPSSESFQSSSSDDSQPRKLYEVPPQEPVVSTDSFKPAASAITDDAPVINEVQPEDRPFDNSLKLESYEAPKSEPGPLDGGEFKPLKSEASIEETVTKSEAPRVEPAKIEAAKIEPAKVEAPKAETPKIDIPKPKSIEVPVPAEPAPAAVPKKLDVPAPASTFTPGETFKPKKPVDSSWKTPESTFKPFEPAVDLKQEVAVTQSPEPVAIPQDDPVDSFFGRGGFKPVAKPLPQPQSDSDGKIVLKANPVERNVVYCPPSKSISRVVVPALQSSFKGSSDGNQLRGLQHTTAQPQQAQVASQELNQQRYGTTASANIVQQPARIHREEPQAQVVETQPKTIPVRLRAIPMNEQMIKNQQVNVRFREHNAELQDIENWQMQAAAEITPERVPTQPAPQLPTPQLATPEPNSVPAAPQLNLTPPSSTEINLQLAIPELDDSAHEHTARAIETDEMVTPPWRIK